MAKQQEFQIEQIHEAVQTFLQPLGKVLAQWLVEQALPEAIEQAPSRKKGFTKKEAALYLGIGESTIDTKRRQGKLVEDYDLGTAKKPRPMFYKSTLDEFMKRHGTSKKRKQ